MVGMKPAQRQLCLCRHALRRRGQARDIAHVGLGCRCAQTGGGENSGVKAWAFRKEMEARKLAKYNQHLSAAWRSKLRQKPTGTRASKSAITWLWRSASAATKKTAGLMTSDRDVLRRVHDDGDK